MYPFFTFADLSLSDVIEDVAVGHIDVSTVGSSGSGNHSGNNVGGDSHLLDADYHSDEDFLVVECRTNNLDLTASLPTPVQSQSQQKSRIPLGSDNNSHHYQQTNITTDTSTATCSDTVDRGEHLGGEK